MSYPFLREALLVPFLITALSICASTALSKAKPSEHTAAVEDKKGSKPSQVGSYGDWGVFVAQGDKSKTCYALATPKERTPPGLTRDPAYMFIANRPGEHIRQEVSVILGFPVKEGAGARAELTGSPGFDLVAKGTNAWIKNQAQEPQFVEALKKAPRLTVKAPSVKGHVTTDSYALNGLAQALERVDKECP